MKTIKRICAMVMALTMAVSMMVSASAADLSDATIDTSRTGSMTIYKYDLTEAEKAGLSDTDYLSTGKDSSEAAAAFKDYAIEGVEFTYLRVGDIKTYMDQSGTTKTIQVVYGISNADLLSALGLSAADATTADGGINYFTSDTLINALSTRLADNNTSTKDKLEAAIKADTNAVAMPLTDAAGKTSADGLELGLYLVVETSVPENVTYTVDPFLVSVPMTDTISLDNWFYDITVYPKNQTGSPTLEKEVADADHGLSFSDAEQGYEDVATASTGDTLNYRIISTLPSIHSTATYLSQYEFLDTLSKGVEYNQNNVKICWYADYADALADYTATTKGTAAVNGANADATWNFGSEFFSVTYGTAADDATTMLVSLTKSGLAEVNKPVSVTDQTGKYSGYTMVIYYTAAVNSDASVVLGDEGNPNDVTLTWSRTTEGFYDTLSDEAKVYVYGIDLTKKFSGDSTDFASVQFVMKNTSDVTGEFFMVADKSADGVYYITGSTADEAKATRFSPDSTGKLLIKGLEEDTYVLTEVKTAESYTLLKESITVDIDTTYTEGTPCGSLTADGSVDGKDTNMLSDGNSTNALVPLTVLNTKGFDLPKTGGQGTLITTVCGVLIVGVAITLVVISRKKKAE